MTLRMIKKTWALGALLGVALLGMALGPSAGRAQSRQPPAAERAWTVLDEPPLPLDVDALAIEPVTGREAYLYILIDGVPAEDRARLQQVYTSLLQGYEAHGFRVHPFVGRGLSGIWGNMRAIRTAYMEGSRKSEKTKLEALAFHAVGSAGVNLNPATQHEIGRMTADIFRRGIYPFGGTAFLALFDACAQGKATERFPLGLAAGGYSPARGLVLTSSAEPGVKGPGTGPGTDACGAPLAAYSAEFGALLAREKEEGDLLSFFERLHDEAARRIEESGQSPRKRRLP